MRRVLYTRGDSPELLASLQALDASSFVEATSASGAPAASSANPSKEAVSLRALELTDALHEESARLLSHLGTLESEVSLLAKCCDDIQASVEATRSSALPLLAETERLNAEHARAEARLSLVDTFFRLYQLTPAESSALEGAVSPAFFAALERARDVHANCRALLRSKSNHRRAGLELMDRMAQVQEAAFERLCRWVQAECAHAQAPPGDALDPAAPDGAGGGPLSSPLMRRATSALRTRPVLLKYCAEEVASARHGAVFNRFLKFCVSPSGPGAAVEAHIASDPARYVSEVLGWVQGAVQEERSLMQGLFFQQGREDEGKGREKEKEDGTEGKGPSQEELLLMDRIFEGICRPLRVRLEQALVSPTLGVGGGRGTGGGIVGGRVALFRICRALERHGAALDASLGPHAALAVTTRMAASLFVQKLSEDTKHAMAQVNRRWQGAPQEKGAWVPPPPLAEELATVDAMLAKAEEPLPGLGAGKSEGMLAGKGSAMGEVGLGLEALCAQCEAAGAKETDAAARHAVRANALAGVAASAARGGAGTSAAATHARGLLDGHIQALAVAAAGASAPVPGGGDLLEIVERIRMYAPAEGGAGAGVGAMAADPALSSGGLVGALDGVHAVVSGGGAALAAPLAGLSLASLRNQAHAKALDLLAEAYGEVCFALADPTNQYPRTAASSIRHSPKEIDDLVAKAKEGLGKANE